MTNEPNIMAAYTFCNSIYFLDVSQRKELFGKIISRYATGESPGWKRQAPGVAA
jgi:hypothetical protein